MPNKTDIVSLKWVIGLMNKQLENAEAALVEYSNDASQKKSLFWPGPKSYKIDCRKKTQLLIKSAKNCRNFFGLFQSG